MTPIHDEIASLKYMLNHEDIAMTKRERKDKENRLWQLEWSSHYCEAKLQEQKHMQAAAMRSENKENES
jgi:hypothetical protein